MFPSLSLGIVYRNPTLMLTVSGRSLQVWGMHRVAESLHPFHDDTATLAAMRLSRTKGGARAFATDMHRLGGLHPQNQAGASLWCSWRGRERAVRAVRAVRRESQTRGGRASNELPLPKRSGECLRRNEANRVDTDSACTLDILLRVVDKHALLRGDSSR